jgi:hypothetical protein
MKLPKPKYKIGDKVRVDDFDNATIAKVGIFRRKSDGKIYVAYQLKDNLLSGFWAEEDRIKIR